MSVSSIDSYPLLSTPLDHWHYWISAFLNSWNYWTISGFRGLFHECLERPICLSLDSRFPDLRETDVFYD